MADAEVFFQGKRLMNGVQEDDYHITVGHGMCVMEALNQNQLRCLPPSDDVPEAKETDIDPGSGGLRVVVGFL